MVRSRGWMRPVILLVTLATASSAAEDPPGLFGRLFRGNGNRSTPSSRTPSERRTGDRPNGTGRTGSSRRGGELTAPAEPPGELAPIRVPEAAAADVPGDVGAPSTRLIPQPRQTRAFTQAEPIVSRTSIIRSDDGKSFAMFLTVYGDGTVVDTEGIHRIGPDLMRPLVAALQSPELVKPRTHCGGPPTDFLEQVHVVVYRKAMGRLMANSFTYSGNTQGCDAAVRKLHESLETIQNKLSAPASAGTAAAAPMQIDPHQPALTGPAAAPRLATPGATLPAEAPPPPSVPLTVLPEESPK